MKEKQHKKQQVQHSPRLQSDWAVEPTFGVVNPSGQSMHGPNSCDAGL